MGKRKKLRRGLTTGTYVAACAKAGAIFLSTGFFDYKNSVILPGGESVNVVFNSFKKGKNRVEISAIKDAGDDPDITDGVEIFVRVKRNNKSEIDIIAGKGIGKVTLPGLQIPAGEPAINLVPRKMIFDNVKPYTTADSGYDIEISIPEGEKLAKKTFNPKLGITGGLSILGTTGYVEPKSVDALKKTIELSIDIAISRNYRNLIFVPGNIGERLCRQYFNINGGNIIQMSNFVGFILEYAAKKKIKRVLIGGHIGKLVKIAAGCRNTSSTIADLRIETMAKVLEEAGETELAKIILNKCKTAENASRVIIEEGLGKVFEILVKQVSDNAAHMSGGNIWIRSAVFNYDEDLLGTDLKNDDIKYWK
ncbi:MAG: cobalt-precorrin-5B (C(1))-methyltransferase CbiD [Actinomycetia bacterium]|nr:cobalt-precorrin-5B (C(1))-methyltransferase CbiD [Actinomycetes bacterium]